LAGPAICSQDAGREYAKRPLVREEQLIQDMRTKLYAFRREKNVAVEAAPTARAAQTHTSKST